MKAHFYDHHIHWAFTSRIVRHHLKNRSIKKKPLSDVISALAAQGHTWTVYPAFYQRLRKMYGKRAYGGMIEEDYPARAMLIDKIKSDGFRRVRLLPFMLVAGMHFEEDLAGSEDSWKTAFIRYKDTETNRKTLLDLIRESSQQGARIILTPEMAIAGYSYDSRRAIGPFLEALNSPTLTLIREAAQTYVVCVCVCVYVCVCRSGLERQKKRYLHQ